ncbi:hypothetical protein [Dechloromonas sp. A34]|uniref:hypothetical protein n=1 Tax=Dechloromonas sp. A34 TaxID=447588 RepID=UPI00224970C3|nr:hypothetical protein [Dechloromonas sp. A34]
MAGDSRENASLCHAPQRQAFFAIFQLVYYVDGGSASLMPALTMIKSIPSARRKTGFLNAAYVSMSIWWIASWSQCHAIRTLNNTLKRGRKPNESGNFLEQSLPGCG